MSKFDLTVAMRIYPGISKEPVYFSENKLEMVRRMLETFRKSVGKLNVKYHIILDSCPPEYTQLALQILGDVNPNNPIEIHNVSNGGNMYTFSKQIDLLLDQNDSEYVMFAEDDYLYLDNQLEKCVEFLKMPYVDFIAPYDHMDYYTLKLHDHPVHVSISGGVHWREANSTTLTFLTKKSVLKETEKYFRTFSNKNWDCSIFWTLSKYHIFSITSLFYFSVEAIRGNTFFLKIWLRCWYFTPLANIFTRRYRLWSPIPSAATHLQEGGLAPNVDWDKIANKTNDL